MVCTLHPRACRMASPTARCCQTCGSMFISLLIIPGCVLGKLLMKFAPNFRKPRAIPLPGFVLPNSAAISNSDAIEMRLAHRAGSSCTRRPASLSCAAASSVYSWPIWTLTMIDIATFSTNTLFMDSFLSHHPLHFQRWIKPYLYLYVKRRTTILSNPERSFFISMLAP